MKNTWKERLNEKDQNYRSIKVTQDHIMDQIYYSDENSLIEKINFLLQNNNWLKIAKSCSNKFKELSNSGDKWHTSEIIL